MHHKRKRPESTRAGCLLCKSHKRQGACNHRESMRFGQRRHYEAGTAQLKCEAE